MDTLTLVYIEVSRVKVSDQENASEKEAYVKEIPNKGYS